MTLGDRLVVMNGGRIEQVGSPSEVYRRPASRFVASFVGSPAMNLMEGKIDRQGVFVYDAERSIPVPFALERRLVGHDVTLGIRAEDVHLDPDGMIDARVWGVENHGVEKIVTLKAGDCLFKATMPATTPTDIDAPMRLSFDQSKLHLFDAETGLNLSQEGRELQAAE